MSNVVGIIQTGAPATKKTSESRDQSCKHPIIANNSMNLAPGFFCEMMLTIVSYTVIYTYTHHKCLYHRCLPSSILVGTLIYLRTRTSCSWFARLPSLSVSEVKHCRAVFTPHQLLLISFHQQLSRGLSETCLCTGLFIVACTSALHDV